MLKKILNYKFYLIIILILLIIEPSITSWLVFCLQRIYNSVTIGTSRLRIIQLILIGVGVWMIKRLLLFSISVIKAKLLCVIRQDIKHDMFFNILHFKSAELSNLASSGEYISIFTNDITIIEQRYIDQVIGLISRICSALIIGASFFTMNKKLAIVVLLFNFAAMLIPPIFSKILGEKNLDYSNKLGQFTQRLKEYINAYSTIRNYSVESIILQKFDVNNSQVEESKYDYMCALSLADSVGSMLIWFTRIMVIGVGLVMLSQGEMVLGTVVAAEAFAEELATPLQGIIENINSVRSTKSIINKIISLATKIQENTEYNNVLRITEGKFNIDFKNVTIKIKERAIVNNFSFCFQHGKRYLVLGKNGSGKTSIFRTLKKRIPSYTGEIFVNDKNLKEMTNEELSTAVAYLNEKVAIFSGSISDNISIWRNLTDQTLEYAISKAHIDLDPNRIVSGDGIDISSGEQRRIEIARSLVCPASIMIFDEMDSTLDVETAYEMEKMVLGYKDKTIIFISHNFSGKLIKEYDEILLIKDGILVAHGDYDFLFNNDSYFRSICEIRFGK